MTTAGIGVITWRASCSCRWKTPVSIPASPGSSVPARVRLGDQPLELVGRAAAALAACMSTPSSRRMRSATAVSATMSGRNSDAERLQRARDAARDRSARSIA